MTSLAPSTTLQLAIVGAVLLVTGAISPSEALTLYQDRSAFQQASQDLTNIDFEGLATPYNQADHQGGYTDYSATGLSFPNLGVTFSGKVDSGGNFPNYLLVVDPSFSPPLYDWGSGAVLLGPGGNPRCGNTCSGPGRIDITLPNGITAIGSDWMSIFPYASLFTITLSTQEQLSFHSLEYGKRSFFGFTSDVPISSISLRTPPTTTTNPNTGESTPNFPYPLLDNFIFGKARQTPDPNPIPTPALLPGLIGLGWGVLRRKRQSEQADASQRSRED